MDLQLKGKSALVTGSTAGIGKAIAKGLAQEGAAVIINGRKADDIAKVVEELKRETGNDSITGIVADFAQKDHIDHLLKEISDVDILVNNVGIFNQVDFADITDDEWFEMFEVNVMSGVRLARHYFPKMLKKNEGRIIFISSESALNIPTEMVHYGFSKTAQLAISRGLARLSKGTNVTVNSVLPGPTMSRANEKDLKAQAEKNDTSLDAVIEDFFEERRPTSLIQRFAETEEVANMVVYVASPLSAATNGAALRVDGGVANYII
ncbi:NAD(P)-dependent dehydrogenase (short-subunit alcohol dehydrogenase family) [Leeuwenhoekiella aestuarii]|uniref:NAD(P)-dependent dehydrogenase (Short-subunit alcohol dehydrogenase family) n=1 Tax=Leeuwenhoekiella aestuarii TaxID=2249426 RepID=A0A4Q0NPK3_9FLAO|nr:SDR family oxidoreductase [Leeuwenhoekiella aestuarii]RXG12291.1 NAD(P)-dependent dehydrogenase (short-subunit alcohol dehydrogenase family) [Leeuwenhoekiella aestuarii]RXG13724.1 NAD(P)-dependent dehydrogenase (short-subunit alcohol dehydrogenase family) [Leeuwenhoekiella aestuarii]